jgi:hypothetical protein
MKVRCLNADCTQMFTSLRALHIHMGKKHPRKQNELPGAKVRRGASEMKPIVSTGEIVNRVNLCYNGLKRREEELAEELAQVQAKLAVFESILGKE